MTAVAPRLCFTEVGVRFRRLLLLMRLADSRLLSSEESSGGGGVGRVSLIKGHQRQGVSKQVVLALLSGRCTMMSKTLNLLDQEEHGDY